MASPKTRRFSNVVFATLSIESWLPVSINCKRRQTPRAVSCLTVTAVNPHSRSQRSSPSSQSVWCETTLRDGSWRFPPLRCSDGSILDRTQRLFILEVVTVPELCDFFHPLFLGTPDHDLLGSPEVKVTDDRGHRKRIVP